MLVSGQGRRRAPRCAALTALLLGSGSLAFSNLGCGSRGEPDAVVLPAALDLSGPRLECVVDEDCEAPDLCAPQRCVDQRCVEERVACVDADPCTRDRCDPASGSCVFEALTADEDGDGHRRPLPGSEPGAAGACGDDCNDASAAAVPGGSERCDGLDNDCDGIVDNGALYSPSAAPALLLSEEADQGSPGGLTFSDRDGLYGAVFTQRLSSSQSTFRSVRPRQAGAGPAVVVAEVQSDTFAGPIVGRGAVFATAWEDRRDDDYEIYFNRLNTRGERLGPDLRVTRAPGFSLRPALLEIQTATARAYRLAWEDERTGDGGRIYGQSFDADGLMLGENVELTPAGLDPSSPGLAAGTTRMGLIFNLAAVDGRGLGFRSFDFDFGDAGDVLTLEVRNPDGASITASSGRFIVAWHVVRDDSRPGPQIWGTVLSETGEELVAARALTEEAPFARYHSLVPLGDRLLLFWSEWRDGAYAIYSRELTPELAPLGPAQRVTSGAEEAYAPLASFGPRGEIGLLYTGQTAQSPGLHALFTSISCDAGSDIDLPR